MNEKKTLESEQAKDQCLENFVAVAEQLKSALEAAH